MGIGTWARLMWTSFGTAIVLSAAQIGIIHELGIVDGDRSFAPGGEGQLRMLLTWVCFSFAVAVLGAVALGRRSVRGTRLTTSTRVTAALAAGLGAAVASPVAWLPAWAAQQTAAGRPGLLTMICAGFGIAIGIVLAVAATSAGPIAASVAATSAWVWIAALLSAASVAIAGTPARGIALGMINAPRLLPHQTWWSGPGLMIIMAALLGLTIATAGRWLRADRLGVALSGLAGPMMLASAYLIAGPGVGSGGGDPARLTYALAALGATVAGVLASTAIAATQRRVPAPAAPAPAGAPARRPAIAAPMPAPAPSLAAAAPRLAIEAAPRRASTPRRVPHQAPASRSTERAAARPVDSGSERPVQRTVSRGTERPAERSKEQPVERSRDRRAEHPVERVADRSTEGRQRDTPVDDVDERRLRPREREHIDWVQNLINLPNNPDLGSPRSAN